MGSPQSDLPTTGGGSAVRAARHPGLAEAVEATDTMLGSGVTEGRSLAEAGPLTAEEVAGIAAAVATTLADLHELGITHGAIDATHVIVTDDGRPVLCSPGRGGEPADDVAAVGRLVTSLLGRGRGEQPPPRGWAQRRRRLGPMLAPPAAPTLAALAAQAISVDPARRPSARALAGAISERVPSARLPRNRAVPLPASPLRPQRQRARWRGAPPLALAAVLVLLVVLAAGALVVVPRLALPDGAKASRGPEAPTVQDPAGSYAVDFDGVLTVDGARYHVGQAGDAVAVGDWACTGRPTPVVLRPSTGELFTFDEWAQPGRDATARPLGRVEHATGVRASRAGAGCHQLEVVRSQGPPARIEVVQ